MIMRAHLNRPITGIGHRQRYGRPTGVQRDIAILRWLKNRIDEGNSISSAVSELRSMTSKNLWPEAIPQAPTPDKNAANNPPSYYATQIFQSLIKHDESRSGDLSREVHSQFDLLTVCMEVLVPALRIVFPALGSVSGKVLSGAGTGVASAYWVDARSALQQKQVEWNQLPVTWPPEASISAPAQLPIDFNHAVELIGYQIKPQQAKPGSSVRVITYWRVVGEVPADLIAFTHLYRTPAEVMAQQDQLDVDGASLQPGDVFIQSHDFVVVPPGTPAGTYQIGVGLYRQDSGERWPIYVGDQRVADRIYLSSVQVTP